MYMLYIGYDAISDRHQQLQSCLNGSPSLSPAQPADSAESSRPQHQQYRKFVQNNKDAVWARDLLAAVACVNRSRNHHKTFFPMLADRNMGTLQRVCSDIITSSTPPHKEVPYMERCYITGVWQEKTIDISKGGRGAVSTAGDGGGVSGASTPLSTTSGSLNSVQNIPTTTGGVYISPRFKHFAQMLWMIAKLDTIIKNYAVDWFQCQDISVSSQSRSVSLSRSRSWEMTY